MKSGRFWAFMPFGALGLTVVLHAVFLLLAASDPSIAVEEDYYRKALDWDRHRAQEAHNRDLGWQVDVVVNNAVLAPVDRIGRTGLEARLTDRHGSPIDGAVVRLTTFHHARAAQKLEATLTPAGNGAYRTALPLRRGGLWAFRLRVERGDEIFTRELDRHLAVR
jgi:nitrogen fixation protein FixH